MTLPILFLLAIALFIIIVILFVRSERRKDRAYASALPSRRQYDCAANCFFPQAGIKNPSA